MITNGPPFAVIISSVPSAPLVMSIANDPKFCVWVNWPSTFPLGASKRKTAGARVLVIKPVVLSSTNAWIFFCNRCKQIQFIARGSPANQSDADVIQPSLPLRIDSEVGPVSPHSWGIRL